MSEITEEDLNSITYFWNEKEDPTRWTEWERKLPALRREYPEIVAGWEGFCLARKILDRLMKGLDYE